MPNNLPLTYVPNPYSPNLPAIPIYNPLDPLLQRYYGQNTAGGSGGVQQSPQQPSQNQIAQEVPQPIQQPVAISEPIVLGRDRTLGGQLKEKQPDTRFDIFTKPLSQTVVPAFKQVGSFLTSGTIAGKYVSQEKTIKSREEITKGLSEDIEKSNPYGKIGLLFYPSAIPNLIISSGQRGVAEAQETETGKKIQEVQAEAIKLEKFRIQNQGKRVSSILSDYNKEQESQNNLQDDLNRRVNAYNSEGSYNPDLESDLKRRQDQLDIRYSQKVEPLRQKSQQVQSEYQGTIQTAQNRLGNIGVKTNISPDTITFESEALKKTITSRELQIEKGLSENQKIGLRIGSVGYEFAVTYAEEIGRAHV